MLDSFASFIPGAWFDEAGLSKGGRPRAETQPKRERRWRHSVTKVPVALVSAGVFAIASVVISDQVTASNLVSILAPKGMSPVGKSPGYGATLGEINESFRELFAAFRGGVNLVTNDRTRLLAEKAAVRRNEKPDGWARKLASDVKDAND